MKTPAASNGILEENPPSAKYLNWKSESKTGRLTREIHPLRQRKCQDRKVKKALQLKKEGISDRVEVIENNIHLLHDSEEENRISCHQRNHFAQLANHRVDKTKMTTKFKRVSLIFFCWGGTNRRIMTDVKERRNDLEGPIKRADDQPLMFRHIPHSSLFTVG